jgi:hypothetical protein
MYFYSIKQKDMKTKSALAIVLTVIGLTVNAQVDSTKNDTLAIIKDAIAQFDFLSYMEELDKPGEDQSHLYNNSFENFGNFLAVIEDSLLWKSLIEKKNGEYIYILAPGTDWVLVNDKVNPARYNEIMIKSSVDSYYSNVLSKVKYEKIEYSYRVSEETGNLVEEYYLFTGGRETDVFLLVWDKSSLVTINHFQK